MTARGWTRVTGVAVLLLGCAHAPAPPAYDRAVGLETFETAWRIVYQTHFDTTFNGVDWPALREELRPHAAAAASTQELRAVIRNMLERLGQSHFALISEEAADTLDPNRARPSRARDGADAPNAPRAPRDAASAAAREPAAVVTGDIGLDVRLVGDDLLVTTVEDDAPAARAGIAPGWIVTAIDDWSIAEALERTRGAGLRWSTAFVLWSAAQSRLSGTVGDSVVLHLRDARDAFRDVALVRRPLPSEPVKFGSMPTFFSRFTSHEARTPAGRTVGVIWFNFWMVPLIRQVDSAMDAYRGLDGIVVDLRGNRGGLGAMVMGVSGHFLDTAAVLGIFQTRRNQMRIAANPRRVSRAGDRVTPYAGPVALLVDEGSVSASEVFAGGMRAVGRVRIFGSTTAGGVLPATWDRLPNGDVLYHAFAEFVTATDEHLEGRGVVPDETVPLTRADLLAGRDAVLDAALAWIDTQGS